ncbi:MAG: hypothetical protein RMY16_08190 [Nostoc sp. DedQUE12b]|nr:hypothetical protein [Nostoc sp. DedQUE12b]
MRLRLSCWRQSRQEQHFQPEARNEALKEFRLKLTPMGSAVPYTTRYDVIPHLNGNR